MDDRVVLGIHSWTDPNTEGSFDRFVDGHAWISVTRNGHTEYYGLWPDDHGMIERRGLSNGSGSDIRTGLEAGRKATESRFYSLTPEQVTALDAEIQKNVTWGYTNTCASWASEVTSRITGEKIDATEYGAFETPKELIDSLSELEARHPTAPNSPIKPGDIAKGGSSSWSVDEDPLINQPGHPFHDMYTRLRDQLPEQVSDAQVAHAVYVAKVAGIDSADKLDRAAVHDGQVFIAGKTPGYLAKFDLREPVPPLAQTSEALAKPSAQNEPMHQPSPTHAPSTSR
ncbi:MULTISPECIES: hypothetical protein [unclassified Lysobacter]|uniref:hypothetical protein n=1 Tax=unclassified Lysobacter TaxID=2635362 RepID=UPI001BE69DD1|nr:MULTISPECIES: hypothetical protein [unclassified Lysobacter]MBT2746990.1 hypothetical protein [Lysobacter sp. ISL-42]MBT2750548.1 hypothetical protein [Lysobacter sp. ISL-50]MBT2776395.1 hypothetical protein [Lysobacter sp. ISL-54]MBT2780889.1 hypothetical protein [Lysobacter sp. ISL-52]